MIMKDKVSRSLKGKRIVLLGGTSGFGFATAKAAAEEGAQIVIASSRQQRVDSALAELPEEIRPKTRVIYQSVRFPRFQVTPRTSRFEVCVLGHLRPVKDPFRTALAARLLPSSSRLQILHLGAALSEEMAKQAGQEAATFGQADIEEIAGTQRDSSPGVGQTGQGFV